MPDDGSVSRTRAPLTLESATEALTRAGRIVFPTQGKSKAANGHADGIAIASEPTLEIINCQIPYSLLLERRPSIADLPHVDTPSGGFHLYYRCIETEPPVPPSPYGWQPPYRVLAWDGNLRDPGILISIVAYAVTYPTPGYRLVSGLLTQIIEISPEQRLAILAACESLDRTATLKASDVLADSLRAEADILAPKQKLSPGLFSMSTEDGETKLLGPNGRAPTTNLSNAVAVLEGDKRVLDCVWFDEFLGKLMTGIPAREWTEADTLNLTLFMQRRCGLDKIGNNIVSQAILLTGHLRVRNCVRDWLDSEVWDGVERIEMFFEDHFGAAATSYTRAASKNFWISLVARIYRPGCQVDNMIVLEGKQGTRKSSALRIIGGERFAEQHETLNGKGFYEVLRGKMLVEISEMDAFSRADITKVKQAITCPSDRYRDSYGHYASDHPRTCIFVGTTNKDDWQRDETGARRFWPIRCSGEIDIDSITIHRSQFFAEAVRLFKSETPWWNMPVIETQSEQRKRYQQDVWFDHISAYLTHDNVGGNLVERISPLQAVTISEILVNVIHITEDRWTRSEQMRVASTLKFLGFMRRQQNDGKWHYVRDIEA